MSDVRRIWNAVLLLSTAIVLSGCAELKDAGRTIGHTTRDVTRDIGHASRDVARDIGHGTRRLVAEVAEDENGQDEQR